MSSAVVSYVINNGPRRVAASTRTKVLEAIDKLGYQPNAAARSLSNGRADLLGLIVSDVRNPYFAALAQAVEKAARARSFNLVLTQGRPGELAPLVEALGAHLVSGIITASIPEAEATAALLRTRIPFVNLSVPMSASGGSALCPDFYSGARMAVDHLVTVHHHRRIGLVMGSDHPDQPEPMEDRERGWRDAMASHGLPADVIIRVDWSAQGGLEAAQRLINDHPDVTAVFVSADQQAIGLTAGLRRAGLQVPSQLAIASFDGSPEAEFTFPTLTTVTVPIAAMAADAVEEILGAPQVRRTYPVQLVIRESCGCGK